MPAWRGLLAHHLAGFGGRRLESGDGWLVAAKRLFQRLFEHGVDLGIIVYPESAAIGTRVAVIDRNQLLPVAQVLVVAVFGQRECLLRQRQETGALIPLRSTLGLRQPAQELGAGSIAFFGLTGNRPQGGATDEGTAGLLRDFGIV